MGRQAARAVDQPVEALRRPRAPASRASPSSASRSSQVVAAPRLGSSATARRRVLGGSWQKAQGVAGSGASIATVGRTTAVVAVAGGALAESVHAGERGLRLGRRVAGRAAVGPGVAPAVRCAASKARALGARPEELGLAAVALAADEADRVHARRRRAVVAVAVVAGGRREVLLLEQRRRVDAALPARVLVHRQRPPVGELVARHALADRRGSWRQVSATWVRVDGRARSREAAGCRGRRGSPRRSRRCASPWASASAVTAGPVLALLVHAQLRAEALHVHRIGVAAAAERRESARAVGHAAEGVGLERRSSIALHVLGERADRGCRRGSPGTTSPAAGVDVARPKPARREAELASLVEESGRCAWHDRRRRTRVGAGAAAGAGDAAIGPSTHATQEQRRQRERRRLMARSSSPRGGCPAERARARTAVPSTTHTGTSDAVAPGGHAHDVDARRATPTP